MFFLLILQGLIKSQQQNWLEAGFLKRRVRLLVGGRYTRGGGDGEEEKEEKRGRGHVREEEGAKGMDKDRE